MNAIAKRQKDIVVPGIRENVICIIKKALFCVERTEILKMSRCDGKKRNL